jgi:hypothetical protein
MAFAGYLPLCTPPNRSWLPATTADRAVVDGGWHAATILLRLVPGALRCPPAPPRALLAEWSVPEFDSWG